MSGEWARMNPGDYTSKSSAYAGGYQAGAEDAFKQAGDYLDSLGLYEAAIAVLFIEQHWGRSNED